ncbi:MAG: protease pro-enzyme activation domain-containing protein [Bryobacteraceae bacterium]
MLFRETLFRQNQDRSMGVRKLAVLALLPLAAGTLWAAEDRIAGPVDLNRTTVLRGHVHPQAQARFDRGPVDPAMPLDRITVLLRPDPALDGFLEELHTPAAPNYRKFLTPEQFGDRFGASPGDLVKIRSWLESQGLQVTDTARGRHWIAVTGTAAAAGRAFHTEFHHYLVNGKLHFANATGPSVPAAFAGVVAGIYGLHDFHPQPLVLPALAGAMPAANVGGAHYLVPDDFATIFDLDPLYTAGFDGAGQSIAVAGQTAINLSDISTFRSQFKLPAAVPQLVLLGKSPGNLGGLELAEADLDIEWSGAVARNANIVFVYSGDVFTSAQYAIDQNLAPVLTFSFEACEQSSPAALRYVAQQANAQGITWMAASGDAGTATCDDVYGSATPQSSLGPSATFPADFPEITAVGGTTLTEGSGQYWASTNDANGGSALSYIPEDAWNDTAARNSFSATGGALSLVFSQPAWQTGPGVPTDGARHVPDVAFPASPDHDGYEVVTNGATGIYGGTSVSSPAFAGIVALLNQYLTSTGVLAQPGLGNINPDLYRLAQSSTGIFHDVTVGNNQVPCVQASPACVDGLVGYSAGPGYDLATGWGSVDAHNLVTQWSTVSATTTSLSATPTSAALGDTVQLTATVSGGGSAIPTGTITFLVADASIGSVTLSAGTATLGTTGVRIAAGNGNITALYSGDGVYDSSGATTAVSITPPAKGSMVVPAISPNPVPATVSASGLSWACTVTLANKTGVATTLTGFTIGGTGYSSQIASFFGTGKIAANGSITTTLQLTGLTPPANQVFTFSGADPDGTAWTESLTVALVNPAGPGLFPQIALASTPGTVVRNPQADSSCPWMQQLTVQEMSGFTVVLNQFVAGGANLASSISQNFGTNRLAPFGTLQGTFCSTNIAPPASTTFTLAGTTSAGTVTASATAQFAAASSVAAPFTATPAAIAIPVSNAAPGGTANLALNFAAGQPRWTISVLPVNGSPTWLSVSPLSGSGSAQVSLTAAGSGLSSGVYQALVAIQSPDAIPQYLTVPVALVVGASTTTAIAGAANNGSNAAAFAPGEQIAVYGTELAPPGTATLARQIPLPLTMAGVSATVNGVAAPFYYASPGQIDLQIPYETTIGPAILAVNNNGQVAAFPLTIASTAPGMYGLWTAAGVPATAAQQGGALVTYTTGEGDVTPSLATGATPPSSTPVASLPKPRQAVQVTVGGVPVPANQLLFVGVPSGLAGVTQINFTVPTNAPLGEQPVVVTVGGVASPAVNLTVTSPGVGLGESAASGH